MKARYAGAGEMYPAHIASIDGHTITVNWKDGDPKRRYVSSKDVYKNGRPCEFVAGR